MAAVAANSLLGLVPPYLLKVLIDDGIKQGDQRTIVAVALVSAGLVVATGLLDWVQQAALFGASARVVRSLQKLAFDHALRMPAARQASRPVGDTVSRITNDAYATRSLVSKGLPQLITSLVSIVGAVVMMFALDWDLALVTLTVVPVVVLVSGVYRRWATPRFHRWRTALGEVTDTASESLKAVDLVQAYRQEERHRAAFAAATGTSRSAEYRTIQGAAAYYPSVAVLAAIANALLVLYGGTQVIRGNSEVGTMVAFFGYLQSFLGPLAGLSTTFRTYESGVAALARIFELVDDAPDSDPADEPAPPFDAHPGHVSLEGVRPGHRDGPALDLTIRRGRMLALVGDPGGGAGQVARMVAGIEPPGTGRVLLDGVDATRVPRPVLRARVGYVSPETGLFEGTVRDNLLLARPDARDADLLVVLSSLFGDDLDDHLRAGLDTDVGLEGRQLNAGTIRLLAIARAAVRTPEVLVLDRIADAFDAETLARLGQARTSPLGGATLVVATSRSDVAELADHVITVGEGGLPVQSGRSDPGSSEPGTSVQRARTPGS